MIALNKFEVNKKQQRGSALKWVTLGYVIFIFVGAFLLSLPISSKTGNWTNFLDALFTSTSATCVTGLVIYDTYIHWTIFGQIVILLLIQGGGIGYMTIITLMTRSLALRIAFKDRKFLMESVGAHDKKSFLLVVRNIAIGSILFELLGAAILSIRFIPQFGAGYGIWLSLFHAISAFCNAGFDLMGITGGEFVSFTAYKSDLLVNITLMVLIFTGGIGFIVWGDVIKSKFKFSEMRMHSKITLFGSVALIILSSFVFYIYEMNNLFKDISFGEGYLQAFFQAVTTRTAGFNTMDMAEMSEGSSLLSIFLMFIGGSSGSTAGGIKVTTFIVIILGIISLTRSTGGTIILRNRQIPKETLHQALAILASYLLAIFTASFIILMVEGFSMKEVLFETVSAMGTVGLTKGITPHLSFISKIVLILMMYVGRIGVLIIVLSLAKSQKEPSIILPDENIMVG